MMLIAKSSEHRSFVEVEITREVFSTLNMIHVQEMRPEEVTGGDN
jgi:hypothetical protein